MYRLFKATCYKIRVKRDSRFQKEGQHDYFRSKLSLSESTQELIRVAVKLPKPPISTPFLK